MRDAFLRFCLYFGKTPVPASKDTVLTYMVFLARSLAISSIPCYMNIVKIMHLEAGIENPLKDWDLSIIHKGIQRKIGKPPQQKLPITPEILRIVRETLDFRISKHRAFWCACVIGFLGFFRKSTLLPKSQASRTEALLLRDIRISQDGDNLYITVRHTKTIQFGQRILTIPFIRLPDSVLCPLKAIVSMLAGISHIQPGSNQPLFSYENGNKTLYYLNHSDFVKQLKQSLSKCGLDEKLYSGHSFRRGGCTYAFSLGLSPLLIKLRGDWRSNAYERYVTVTDDQQNGIAKVLSLSL